MCETWRPVIGYEGLYDVSSDGRIRNAKTKRELAHGFVNGYKRVNLWKNNSYKTRRIHRIVAEAFIENPYGKRTVNHKDGNKTNNSVENLEWATHSENNKHAYLAGLKSNNTPIIVDGKHMFISQCDAAKYLGVSQSFISNCIRKGRVLDGHTIEMA